MPRFRLGDDVDDFCTKCKRLTNHSIVSLLNEEPAKVRCRTCYSDHDFRRGEIPPSKKDLKKQQLFNEVLSTVNPATEATPGEEPVEEAAAQPAELPVEQAAEPPVEQTVRTEAPKPVKARKSR
jgi:hypothetical protein